ncbi:MAG: M48 family metallopeptidase [Gemmataceae bacterium]
MPILLILLVTAACLPVPWPAPPLGIGPEGAAALTGLATGLAVLCPVGLSAWAARTLARDPTRRPTVVRRYARFRRLFAFGNIGLTAALVTAGGWGWTVWHAARLALPGRSDAILCPGAEVLVPAPYFVLLFAGWSSYFFAERALYRTSHRGAADPGGFWHFPGYLLFHARQFAMLIGFPVGLFLAQQGLARACPGLVRADWFQAVSVAAGVAVFVFLPRAVKPVLGLQSLPGGPARDRLEATARRLGVRCTDLLLWPTRGAVANAMVIGVVPWARYVIFTDRLLDGLDPEELEAVFGHEAGHVAHQHIPFYAGFFALSAVTATAAVAAASKYLTDHGLTVPPALAEWVALPPVVLMAAYVFVVFGLLSRKCERQADVYGCRAASCGDPFCGGHTDDTDRPAGDRQLCRTGVRALVRALDHVDGLNGADHRPGAAVGVRAKLWGRVKAWQHGPVPDRIEFLLRLTEDPTLGDAHDRRVRAFRAALVGGLATVLAACGSYVGWAELWKMM